VGWTENLRVETQAAWVKGVALRNRCPYRRTRAVAVPSSTPRDIDLDRVEAWSKRERATAKFKDFAEELSARSAQF
jgi:hypothetical protein